MKPLRPLPARAAAVLGAALLFATRAAAAVPIVPQDDAMKGESVTLALENDLFFNTDRYYTNGVSAAFTTARSIVPQAYWEKIHPWLDLGSSAHHDVLATFGGELAQMMATPRSISSTAPQPGDRPWAGLLYFAPSLSLKGEDRLYTFKLALGVVGHWSLADRAQRTVHKLRHFDLPLGWHNQLPNEVVFGVAFEKRERTAVGPPRGWQLELIRSVGYKLGTIEDSARAGAEFRAGFRLPDDFGTSQIGSAGNLPGAWQGGKRSGWFEGVGAHAFAGASGTVVLYQVMLDGTVFHDSPSVARIPIVARMTYGFALTTDRFRLSYQVVQTSREFRGQPEHHRFSSIVAGVFW